MSLRHRSLLAAVTLGAAVTACFSAEPGATAAPAGPPPGAPVVITRGLDNPRQLSLLPDGSVLLVAEAGSGGPDCTSGGPEGETCVGFTGAIAGVTAPRFVTQPVVATRFVTGLLSGASSDGSSAAGSDGVSARTLQAIHIAMTYAPPDVLPTAPASAQAGKLLRNAAYRKPTVFADITAYEQAHDPDGQGVDSNPYGVLALGNGRVLVADAAANDILDVDRNGHVSLFTTLPNITNGQCTGQPNDNGTTGCDFVPTSLAQGPDGAIYVGALGGLTNGAGRVYRLDPTTGAITKRYATFGSVTGVAIGPDGSLYVSQLSFDPSKGKVTRVKPDGSRTDVAVPFPAGVAVDASGAVFVSAFSIAPATGLGIPGTDSSGQIWKISFPN